MEERSCYHVVFGMREVVVELKEVLAGMTRMGFTQTLLSPGSSCPAVSSARSTISRSPGWTRFKNACDVDGSCSSSSRIHHRHRCRTLCCERSQQPSS